MQIRLEQIVQVLKTVEGAVQNTISKDCISSEINKCDSQIIQGYHSYKYSTYRNYWII